MAKYHRFYKNRYRSGYLVCTKDGRNRAGQWVNVTRQDGRHVQTKLGKRLTSTLYRIQGTR